MIRLSAEENALSAVKPRRAQKLPLPEAILLQVVDQLGNLEAGHGRTGD